METRVITKEQMLQSEKMSSFDIAKVTGKEHRNVIRSIKNMESAWEEVSGSKFEKVEYREPIPKGGYHTYPCYLLNKTECLFVATKFNDVARAKLVLRWEELETGKAQEQIQNEPQKMLVTEKEILKRSDEIRRQEIVDQNAHTDGCITITEIAKEIGLTTKEVNKTLIDLGIQYWNGGRYRITKEFEDMGLAMDRVFHYYAIDGTKKERKYLVWTVFGAEYIKGRII